jgi:hypothetical protein
MKNLSLIIMSLFTIWIVITGCESDDSINNPVLDQYKESEYSNFDWNNLSKLGQETLVELAQVRAATAQYHDINQALADGYVDINYFVSHMGWHFLKFENLDGTFELTNPELLVYAPKQNGQYQLVAAEYATPWTQGSTPPEGFTGNNDVWSHFEGDPTTTEDDLWTLHAWVWYHNPEGMFNPTNPRVD